MAIASPSRSGLDIGGLTHQSKGTARVTRLGIATILQPRLPTSDHPTTRHHAEETGPERWREKTNEQGYSACLPHQDDENRTRSVSLARRCLLSCPRVYHGRSTHFLGGLLHCVGRQSSFLPSTSQEKGDTRSRRLKKTGYHECISMNRKSGEDGGF